MPQIIAVAAGVLSLYYAFRWFRRESNRVEAAFRRTDRRIRRAQVGALLAFNKAEGVYRPVD